MHNTHFTKEFEKNVGFGDCVSERSGNKYYGFISQNPDIFTEDFVLKLGIEKLDVDWFNEDRDKWKERIEYCLNLVGINYEYYSY